MSARFLIALTVTLVTVASCTSLSVSLQWRDWIHPALWLPEPTSLQLQLYHPHPDAVSPNDPTGFPPLGAPIASSKLPH